LLFASPFGVRDAFVRTAAAVVLATACAFGGCASQQDTIQQQREKLESLGASTRLLVADWLAGDLSPRYARAAFDALYRQVEQQRTILAAAPAALADPQGAVLSQQAEQLSRTIAAMQQDLSRGDERSLRRRLVGLPFAEGQ
jgi:hypothetical protein